MEKNVKLKQIESSATNRDFYDLFRPIVPSLDITGKIAQVISAITEAVTVWFIMQSELSGTSKVISITLSVLAVVLMVSILELGGRKFLQVLTRAIIWKKLENIWYKVLFGIVSCITIGMCVLSFYLSTNGIRHAFTSKATLATIEIDHSAIKEDYKMRMDRVDVQYNQDLKLLQDGFDRNVAGLNAQYDTQIEEANLKAEEYEQKSKKGLSWADSHARKYHEQAAALATLKASKLAKMNEAQSGKVDAWKKSRVKMVEKEQNRLDAKIAAATTVQSKKAASQLKVASFWGSLFSGVVGFTIVLAYFCIITVEVFRRGSGIEVAYEEVESIPSTLALLWSGIQTKTSNLVRRRAERFAGLTSPTMPQRAIGFQTGSMPSYTNKGTNTITNGYEE